MSAPDLYRIMRSEDWSGGECVASDPMTLAEADAELQRIARELTAAGTPFAVAPGEFAPEIVLARPGHPDDATYHYIFRDF